MKVVFLILAMIITVQANAQDSRDPSIVRHEQIVEASKLIPACEKHIESSWPPKPYYINFQKPDQTMIGVVVNTATVLVYQEGKDGYVLYGETESIRVKKSDGAKPKDVYAKIDPIGFSKQLDIMIGIFDKIFETAQQENSKKTL